jgi:glucose-specific phosphotransferase system IIA component
MTKVYAPMTGKVIPIDEVPDPVFAQKMMGDGVAIVPTEEVVVAPCDGLVIHVFPTKHAVGLLTKEGEEILIHIGLETVNLKGKGFEAFVKENEAVKQGQELIKVNLKYVKKYAKSLVTPIVITNMDKVNSLSFHYEEVTKGKDIIMEIG